MVLDLSIYSVWNFGTEQSNTYGGNVGYISELHEQLSTVCICHGLVYSWTTTINHQSVILVIIAWLLVTNAVRSFPSHNNARLQDMERLERYLRKGKEVKVCPLHLT